VPGLKNKGAEPKKEKKGRKEKFTGEKETG